MFCTKNLNQLLMVMPDTDIRKYNTMAYSMEMIDDVGVFKPYIVL